MRFRRFVLASRPKAIAVGFLLIAACSFPGHGGSSAADEPVTSIRATLSPFGIGSCYTNNRSAQDNERWIPQMAAIGITNHRTGNTGWEAVEPEEGKWRWDELDRQLAYLEGHHMTFGVILAGNAVWNRKDQPGSLPVNSLPAWSRYVSEVAKHVRGKAKYFEVWNEPPNFTGRDQTPADYARIVVSAHDAVKAVDPTALVGLAAKSAHVNYLEQVIKAGAKDHFDFITLHPYEVLDVVVANPGSESIYMNITPTVRKMLAAQNPARVNVPIIFTELGHDAGKSPENQGRALVKAYTMGIAQGVTCIQWFEGRDGDSGPMGLLDGKGTPRPSYTAMAQMIRHLGQHPAYLGWVLIKDKDYGFVFRGAKGTVLATWGKKGRPDRVEFGQDVRIVDPLTGQAKTAKSHEMTIAPVLVLGVPENLLAQAKANRVKPFPWGGDYTNAKSVSITMDRKPLEKGLHTASGDQIAGAVVGYGGSGRAGDIPGGNVFLVDPNFLSYTTTPIEVTLVVRRNAANDNSGFKLVYESTDGYKNLGWYTVPDNTRWHTVKWKITDPQFVSMWGYNFSLDSDGNQYNKYFIRSVTVTKLDQ